MRLLQLEQLQQRGISAKLVQLIINCYPVLVLSNELLEELFCPKSRSRWCHADQHDTVTRTARSRAAGACGFTAANPMVNVNRPMQSNQWTAAFMTDLMDDQGEDRIKCRAFAHGPRRVGIQPPNLMMHSQDSTTSSTSSRASGTIK